MIFEILYVTTAMAVGDWDVSSWPCPPQVLILGPSAGRGQSIGRGRSAPQYLASASTASASRDSTCHIALLANLTSGAPPGARAPHYLGSPALYFDPLSAGRALRQTCSLPSEPSPQSVRTKTTSRQKLARDLKDL